MLPTLLPRLRRQFPTPPSPRRYHVAKLCSVLCSRCSPPVFQPVQVFRDIRGEMWTTEKTLALIDDYRTHTCLWDPTDVDYKNKAVRGAAMDQMAIKFKVSVHELEKKIHCLKSQFRREFRTQMNPDSKSNLTRITWFGYEPMMFLLKASNEFRNSMKRKSSFAGKEEKDLVEDYDHEHDYSINEASQHSTALTTDENNLDYQTITYQNVEDMQPASEHYPDRTHAQIKAAKQSMDLTMEAFRYVQKLTETANTKDSFSIFGDFVVDSLRNCNRPEMEVIVAKQKISDVVFNLLRGFYSSETNSKT